VPANWEIEGFSRPTFQNRGKEASDDIGLYRRLVFVPKNFSGKQVLWHFDGVYDGAEVFVNGRRAGYHESGFTAFDIDVTRALKPGQNKSLRRPRLQKNAVRQHGQGRFLVPGRNLSRQLPRGAAADPR
jgi:beta-galactosidase